MTVPAPRYGGRRALRGLRSRHLERLALLGTAVAQTPQESAALAAEALARAARLPGPFDDALVTSFGSLAAAQPAPEAAQGRLLHVLVDLEHRSVDRAGALLALPVDVARDLLARTRTDGRFFTTACRGWGLASGSAGLTAAERRAGTHHLALCRRCRERLAAVETARRQLAVRATGTAGVLAAGQIGVAGGAVSIGVGGLLAGKAAAGIVAALGGAVLATGTAVAVVPPAGFTPAVHAPAVVPDTVAPSVVPAASTPPRPTATSVPSATPSPAGCVALCVPPLVPTAVGIPVLGASPLPGAPGLPLPTVLPTVLPTLPVPLPTVSLPPLLP